MSGNGQGHATGREPVERVIDLFVHTPIGLAVMAWKRVPEFVVTVPDLVGQVVAKGCAQLAGAEERVSEEVRKARMIGQVAVTFGGRQLRREVDARLRDARQAAGGVASFLPGLGGDAGSNGTAATGPATAPVTATATPSAPTSAPEPAGERAPAATGGAKPAKAAKTTKPAGTRKAPVKAASAKSAAELPIPEYDGLSASQVVSRLTGLTPDELRSVRAYEEASRARRTVVVAIDRLLG